MKRIKKLQAPSIVMEWETVEDGGVDRAERGLREVSRQLAELEGDFDSGAELVVCYEERVISESELRSLLDRVAGPSGWACSTQLVAVPNGTSYYGKKNAGARVSTNEIIVFLDTDVVPDPDWLRNLLDAFEDWSVSVLVGSTRSDHASTYEMAVALIWIFDPATYGRGIQPVQRYWANNLAFRRAVFQRFPFPDLPTYRGQCGSLANALLSAGIAIRQHTDARVSHPPPPGPLGFIQRAWAAGRDEQFYASLKANTSVGSAFRQLSYDFGVVAKRVRERRVMLKPTSVAEGLGWLLGWAYYGIKSTSYLWHIHDKPASASSRHAAA